MRDIIYVDLDDTVLEWCNQFHSYAKAFFPSVHSIDPTVEKNLHRWVAPEDFRSLIGLIPKFNESHLFGSLPPVPGAFDSLSRLSEAGFRLVALSSCGDSELTRYLRLLPVERHFEGLFERVHVLPLHTKKHDFIFNDYDRFSKFYLLDDTPEQISSVASIGGHCYFFDRASERAGRDQALLDAKLTSTSIIDLTDAIIESVR